MSCEIIQFSAATRPARKAIDKRSLGQRLREARPELPPSATETAKNSRIRFARRDAWWHAARAMSYWRARLDWYHALGTAQRYGIADSASLPLDEDGNRFGLVDKWRAAIAKLLLTPAPDLAAITWKRAKLESSDFPHLPVKKERVDRAIADDEAFLAAHPTRRAKKGGAS